MKKILAITIAKILYFLGKLMGRGSSLPGRYALKICPDILKKLKLPDTIIAVTGSNGKTSSVEMLVHALEKNGKKVGWNSEGANQTDGVATMLLRLCGFGGKAKCDVIVLESDERYAKHTFKSVKPTHLAVLNLYRDQLTRNGHPEFIYSCIDESISDDIHLILNADDPYVSMFANNRENVTWFGIAQGENSLPVHTGVYNDGAYCPVCKNPMEYSFYHYAHIGGFLCKTCGHARKEPDYCAENVDLKAGRFNIGGHEIPLAFSSIYNVANICAAYAAALAAGADGEKTAAALSGYILKNGRVIREQAGGRSYTVLTSKHENSISYNCSIDYAISRGEPCTAVFIVDTISRKYFTCETSWLWDINFEKLGDKNIKNIVLAGAYCDDLALRFSFADIDAEKIVLAPDLDEMFDTVIRKTEGDIYVITCFTDKPKFISRFEKMKEGIKA